jgi:hypothetical protein
MFSELQIQSMFAVGWMELKDPSKVRDLLDRSFTNVTEPFKVSRTPPTILPLSPWWK